MTVRSPANLEDLLRRTYAEVAARTSITQPTHAATAEPAASRWQRQLLAATAVLVLIVGGLLVLANRDAERPAGRGTPTRVVPGWVPRLTTPGGDWRTFALSELTSTSESDRITYSADAGEVTLTLDRTRTSLPDGTPTEVRGGDARRTGTSLAWIGPRGAVVEVSWSGDVTDQMVDSFVQGLAEVDERIWNELAGTGGFREDPYEPLASVRIDADVPFEVELVGDLHQGLSLELGSIGFPAGSIDRCAASVNDRTSDWESDVTGYTVLAPGDVTSAVVRATGADDRVVEMTSLLPLVDVSIGGVVYDDRTSSEPLPRVDCEERS